MTGPGVSGKHQAMSRFGFGGVLLLVGCAAAPPADDPFGVPTRPVIYKTADCPPPLVRPTRSLDEPDALPTLAGGPQAGPLAVTHAGVGTPPDLADGALRAAIAARQVLLARQPALEAAVAGTVVLEDDPRYNAGTGANIRLDGKTIQMDASLMTDDGAFAAVAVIERVKNPIRAARLVLDSPHVLMAGEGATVFAHRAGLPDEVPVSPEAQTKYEARLERLRSQYQSAGTLEFDWKKYWNFPNELPADMEAWRHGGDTVGTVVRDVEGGFAATLSTGGTSVTLYGRVGDVPVYGAGLYAGPAGAVACTGHGEVIIREALARTVYEQIASGVSARAAVHRAASDFPEDSSVGLIAVDRAGWGVAANREMAYGVAKDAD